MVEVLRRYSNPGDQQACRSAAIRAAIPVKTPDEIPTPRRATKRARRLSDAQARMLVDAYLTGDSTYLLARRFGLCRETVSGHLERAGVARRGRTCPLG